MSFLYLVNALMLLWIKNDQKIFLCSGWHVVRWTRRQILRYILHLGLNLTILSGQLQ